MTNVASDNWATGDAYEVYMGRWSRGMARRFLEWLGPARGGHWLEIGCGTGALTSQIIGLCEPASVVACDPSAGFIEHARRQLPQCTFQVIASAEVLPERAGGFDVVVSGLVLTFLTDLGRALTAMQSAARPGATVAAYIWDYSGGLEFLSHFWQEAMAVDPAAASLDESRRFADWDRPALAAAFGAAGLGDVETQALEIVTSFTDFDDYWSPFLGGSGPAPSYVASLDGAARELLRSRLERRLRPSPDGRIELRARALAVRGSVGQRA